MWILTERLSEFREKESSNGSKVKQIFHRVNSLYVHRKNSNYLRSQYIRPGNQILPKEKNPVAHVRPPLCLRLIGQPRNIILCYKGRL